MNVSSGTGSPRLSGTKGCKTIVVVVVCQSKLNLHLTLGDCLFNSFSLWGIFERLGEALWEGARVRGRAVSSPSGIYGKALANNGFGAFLP